MTELRVKVRIVFLMIIISKRFSPLFIECANMWNRETYITSFSFSFISINLYYLLSEYRNTILTLSPHAKYFSSISRASFKVIACEILSKFPTSTLLWKKNIVLQSFFFESLNPILWGLVGLTYYKPNKTFIWTCLSFLIFSVKN